LSTNASSDSSSINQNFYGFLNNLYLGNSKIENQTFRLVPAGVIANYTEGYRDRNSYNNNGFSISQFISIDELKFGIQERYEKEKTGNKFSESRLKTSDVKRDYKQFIKGNYKMIPGDKFYNLYPELFSTFSFVKGKLLTITNENDSKDYLFSVRESESNSGKSLEEKLGQKGIYFSLTDDNEKEYLLELVAINDEVYLRINNTKSRNNNSLNEIGMKWVVTGQYKSSVVHYKDGSRGRKMGINDSRNPRYFSENYYSGDFYLECDKLYISPFLIPSIYESAVRITPEMFLFKLEEIQ
jgi:hypothetical protein